MKSNPSVCSITEREHVLRPLLFSLDGKPVQQNRVIDAIPYGEEWMNLEIYEMAEGEMVKFIAIVTR